MPLTASIAGTVREKEGDSAGGTTITLAGTLGDGANGLLQVVLHGNQAAGGGIVMDSSEVTMGSSSQPSEYRGEVVRLRGSAITANLQDQRGNTISVQVQLQIDDASNTFTGDVTAGPLGRTGQP